jgi:hypothetical protein
MMLIEMAKEMMPRLPAHERRDGISRARPPGALRAEENKRKLRGRLRDLAREAGARDAESLADQLVLLFKGVYASAQTFGGPHPATRAAAALLAAQLD